MSATKSYNRLLLEKYKELIGKKNLKTLMKRFDSTDRLLGTWEQVSTSLTTGIIGTGQDYSSVQATYKKNDKGTIRVVNEAYDPELNRVSIQGVIVQIDKNIPTCLTVTFDNNPSRVGNYWIAFATPSGNTIIIMVPLVVKLRGKPYVITKNFAHYVLTQDSEAFWNSPEEHVPTLNALKRLGFVSWYNKARLTGRSLAHEPKPDDDY